ncbi:MAG: cytochrome c4 [Gammaproteobacteria bacterium]|nr:MAG: cytochrome c4 [Gammaproteobacteria bacterium]
MQITPKQLLLALALLGLAGGVQAAGDPEAGKGKAAACAGCHGADGNSPSPQFPKLAGQHASYLLKQLKDYKSGARKDPTMSGMAAPLSEKDMEDLAAYFASQTPKPAAAEEKYVALGERIYRGGIRERKVPACMACHGPDGLGNPAAAFPRLSGQHAAYTAKQLRAFKAETRANDPNGMMRDSAFFMKDGEIEAVAGYIQGLH